MKTKTTLAALAVALIVLISLSVPSFAQEMPKPGTVIDKNNYKKYAHLFPPEFLPAFEDGYGGLMKPASIIVGEPKMKCTPPKAFLAASAANKGKFSVNAKGNLLGGWQRNGMPFPDLQRSDKDFVTKFMWNYAGRYTADDEVFKTYSYMQRKGEPVRWSHVIVTWLYFTNRAVIPPTPIMKNPGNVAYAGLFFYKEPESMKNMQTLSLRYMDPDKADETYIYLPALRRVLRGDSGQRAVPLQGNLASLDDINLFDGKTDEFTYKFVGEQTVLNSPSDLHPEAERMDKIDRISIPSKGWVPTEVYVIDIVAKDPVYPQSKKRIWIDKTNLTIHYAAIWDRAGKLWKVWHVPTKRVPQGDTCMTASTPCGFGVDIQFGMAGYLTDGGKINAGGLTWDDMSPAALVKKAR